ncbi:hypothetical protein LINPERPRIM_LOCUS38420 [Linum perenne]
MLGLGMHLTLDCSTMFGFSSTTILLARVSPTLKKRGSNGLVKFLQRRSSSDCQLHLMQLGAVSFLPKTSNLRSYP